MILKRVFSTVVILILMNSMLYAQQPIVSYENIKVQIVLEDLMEEFGNHKKLPEGYELQALLALSHYPELKNVKIKFKKRKNGAPFVSRPTIWSTFFRRPDKRTYLILIRTKEHSLFSPILLENMPFDAQVGVLGHELAHSTDFKQRSFFKMLNVTFGNLSWKFLDQFEFETDRRAIQHGLGFQLLAWSEHAIKTLRVNEPAAPKAGEKVEGIINRERYMRPNTIKMEMKSLQVYNQYLDLIGLN